ncbi:MAG: RNA polymerase sigma-70 factor [Microbacterium sp.]|jgi:RNA polymerase sigma-70 factor (ECF subfamily)|nr:RNA polymerase sigma-70 factor [Microbacterium sp.]
MDKKKWPVDDLPAARSPMRLWKASDPEEIAELDAALAMFMEVRPRLFSIAYRMLGSVADAEDLLQETWMRWQHYDRDTVEEPAAFLTTIVTRMAINELRSARVRREAYVGPWLPEPIDTGSDPELAAEDDETIELGVLFLLERLAPAERAAYVLHEAFAYPYSRIAEVIETTEANARQLASRARRHLAVERGATVGLAEQRRFLVAFLAAARAGDIAQLEALLTADIVSHSDGGGAVRTARIPLTGRHRVALFVAAIADWFLPDVDIRWAEVNGRAAGIFVFEGQEIGMLTASATSAGLDHLYWMMNPAKLGAVIVA